MKAIVCCVLTVTFVARYDTSAVSNQGGTGFVGSCSPHDNSSEAMKTDSTYNMKSNSDAAPINQGSNGSSNNNDMGSTTKNVVTKPTTNKERVSSPSAIKANAHTSAFHPVQQWTVPANATGKAKGDEMANNATKNGHPGEVQSNLMQHPRPILYVHFDVSRENGGGSSNAFDPPLEGQAANYGTIGSNSGSNNGTNGQNGSTAAANAERTNTEIANGAIDKSGPRGGNGSGSGSGNDTYVMKRMAPTPREAQLMKYREKKKDRNFGKKVACFQLNASLGSDLGPFHFQLT